MNNESEKLPKSLIKYGNEVVGVSNLIFASQPDYDLMLLEIDRMQTVDPVAFENQIYAIHSKDYLNNIGKINCARALRSILAAKRLFYFVGSHEEVFELITDAGYFLGLAREQYESVTVTASKKQDKSKESRRELIAQYRQWAIDNEKKYSRQQAAFEISQILLKQHGITVGQKRIYEEWLKGL
jgi:hypothetical protein